MDPVKSNRHSATHLQMRHSGDDPFPGRNVFCSVPRVDRQKADSDSLVTSQSITPFHSSLPVVFQPSPIHAVLAQLTSMCTPSMHS